MQNCDGGDEAQRQITRGRVRAADGGAPSQVYLTSPTAECAERQESTAGEPSLVLRRAGTLLLTAAVERPAAPLSAAAGDLWTGTEVRSHPQSGARHRVFICRHEGELDAGELVLLPVGGPE